MDSSHDQHHHHQHHLSPSFTDSAIDIDLSDSGHRSSTQDRHTTLLHDRLIRLAHLAAERSDLSEHDSVSINKCLDTIESHLDPRPELSQEIARHRPRSSRSSTSTIGFNSGAGNASAATPHAEPVNNAEHHQLAIVLDELTAVNAQLQQRRIESRHIHDLFTLKCEGLAQRIIQLGDEVHDLQSDILEDSIELEGLRGTVRGLESWVGRWQRQRALAEIQAAPQIAPRKARWKRRKDLGNADDDENDTDTLIDGITAWMRGWKDVEEGFRIRARRRKARRDQRRKRQVDDSAYNVDIEGAEL